jgi:membrane protease YdiL (CAAX protease family)
LSAFAIGCLLGWIYFKTRTILPCIFIHFVNNFSAVLMYYIFVVKSNYSFDTTVAQMSGTSDLIAATFFLAIFLICIFGITKIFAAKNRLNP